MNFRCQVLGDAADDRDVRIFDGREHHHRGLPFIAQRIDQRAKLLAVEAIDLRGEHFDAFDLASLRFQLAASACAALFLSCCELLLERFFLGEQFFDLFDQFASEHE